MDTVTITSPDGETAASFTPAANLLCASLTHQGAELLDQGQGIEAYAQRGKTMGIPLLYPWANRLSRPGYEAAGQAVTLPAPESRYAVDPNGLPIHGALPELMVWKAQASGDRLRAVLNFAGDALLELFPFPHRVEVDAVVDHRGLRLTTTVTASEGVAVPVSFGYHPYLTITDSERNGWQVDLGASSQLVLSDQMIPTGQRTELHERDFLLGDSSWDDGLADLATPPQFLVSDGEKALSLTFEQGYAWGQVYAPPGKDFICFEPMTAPTDALNSGTGLIVLAPGESHHAAFAVSVLP